MPRRHYDVAKRSQTADPSKDKPIEGGRDWSKSPVPHRQCTAHRKNGDRCKNSAILGGNVCKFHGGNAAHVKKAARVRLDKAADRMAKLILGLAESAESETVRLQAITKVLALAGVTEKSAVEVEHKLAPWQELLSSINFGETRAEARARRGEPPASDGDEVLDAEVIDDEDEPDFRAVRNARGRTDALPHTKVGRIVPEGYSAVQAYPGMPEGYMPLEEAMECAAQTRRVPDGSSRSRSARFRR